MSLPITAPMSALLVNGTHRFATCWRITMSDGTVVRYTDHDTRIERPGDGTYTPAGALQATALQKLDGLRNNTAEVRAAFEIGKVEYDAVRAGGLRRATVEEFLVDHRFPWAGEFSKATHTVTGVQRDGETWTATIAGLSARLRERDGAVYARPCRHRVGRGICGQGVDLADYTAAGAVTAVLTQRRLFRVSSLAGTQSDHWYDQGELTFTTGANAGRSFEVKNHRDSDCRIQLFERTPFDIQVGDEVSVHAGCDGRLATCTGKFNNAPNHGGHPTLPGTDAVVRTPDANV